MEQDKKFESEEMIHTIKSAEELIAFTKEQGIEMTAEQAAELFEQMKKTEGELSDEELDNVSGGLLDVLKAQTSGKATPITSGCDSFMPLGNPPHRETTCQFCMFARRVPVSAVGTSDPKYVLQCMKPVR